MGILSRQTDHKSVADAGLRSEAQTLDKNEQRKSVRVRSCVGGVSDRQRLLGPKDPPELVLSVWFSYSGRFANQEHRFSARQLKTIKVYLF